jgi:hypothetical protein
MYARVVTSVVRNGPRFLQIADYKSSDEESEEESPSSKRKAPGWTSSPALRAALNNMGAIDSDAYVPFRVGVMCDLGVGLDDVCV